MINLFSIFDDIIPIEEQNKIESFVKSENSIWNPIKNITGEFGGYGNEDLPAELIEWETISDEIISIVKNIRKQTLNKIQMEYVKTYRVKINKTFPLENVKAEKLMHVDMAQNHLTLIYYINDIDGDTLLFNNKKGNNAESLKENYNKINLNDFELIQRISPKKGRVLVFNGNLYHYGEFPKKDNRFIINYNIAAVSNIKKNIL